MGVMDKVRAFFEKEPQARDLSSSVVTHDRVDNHYLEDFRAKATKFEAIYEAAPDVVSGDPPAKCPSCGSEEPKWSVVEGQLACGDCEHPVAMPTQQYSQWDDVVSDTFRSYFTQQEPGVKPQSEIKPSHELHRRIFSRVTSDENFLDSRPMTRLNEMEAAWAAMSLTGDLKEQIETGVLAEHARRAQAMAEEQQKIEDLERELDELRERFNDDQLSDEEVEQVADMADAHQQAQDALQDLHDQQEAAGMGVDVQQAVDEAVEKAEEEAELLSSMPGMGPGENLTVKPDVMFELAERWRENEVLRGVAELLGRMEREMRYKRAHRVVGGFEEVVDIELGDNIALAMPAELMKLRHPTLRKQFQRQFIEKSIQQFELRGNEPEGKGPLVMLVDGSYSMEGSRNKWARAVALALTNIAHSEKRDVAVIEFGSSDEQRAWKFKARVPLDIEQVIEFAAHWFAGGTDITPAVKMGRDIMVSVPEFKKADLVLISDGEDQFREEDQALKDELGRMGVRIHGVAIGDSLRYLDSLCDSVTQVTDLSMRDPSNEATDQLAVAVN